MDEGMFSLYSNNLRGELTHYSKEARPSRMKFPLAAQSRLEQIYRIKKARLDPRSYVARISLPRP
jgi:hypothetical protein